MLTSIIRYVCVVRDKNELSPIQSGRTKELYSLRG